MSALPKDAGMLVRWVVSAYLYWLELKIDGMCKESGKDCRDVLEFLENERLTVLELAADDVKRLLVRG